MTRKAIAKISKTVNRYKNHIAVLQRNTDPPTWNVRWSHDPTAWDPRSHQGAAYHALFEKDKAGAMSTRDKSKLPELIAKAVAEVERVKKGGKAAPISKRMSPVVRQAAKKSARKPTQKSLEAQSPVLVESAAPPSSLDIIELDAIESTLAPTTLHPVSSGVVLKPTGSISMSTSIDVQQAPDGKFHATMTFAARRAFTSEAEAYTWANAIQASHTRFQATLEQRAGNGGFARHRETGT